MRQMQLERYVDQRLAFREAVDVDHVELPLGQPAAKPLVTVGQSVREGELLAEEEVTGARVHASIHGRIRLVDAERIVVAGQDG
jgi:Na+-translocating ferredoxin:NAD+ oxidoreductase RnfC subunit